MAPCTIDGHHQVAISSTRFVAVAIEVHQVTNGECRVGGLVDVVSFGLCAARMIGYTEIMLFSDQIKVIQGNLGIGELVALCPHFAS